MITIETIFKPLQHLLQDFPRTFTPYKQHEKEFKFESFLDEKTKTKKLLKEQQDYRDETVWGDLLQPLRGLANISKGLLRILMGLLVVGLFPLAIPIICVWRMRKKNEYVPPDQTQGDTDNEDGNEDNNDIYETQSFLHELKAFLKAFLRELKKLSKETLYYLTNGLGILLRGTLQLLATPWLLIRIPLRLAITEGVYKQAKYRKYNAVTTHSPKFRILAEFWIKYKFFFKNPLARIIDDFKGTLAAYDTYESHNTDIHITGAYVMGANILGAFIRPLRGVWNVVCGVLTVPFALIRLLLLPFEAGIRCGLWRESAKDVFLKEGRLGETDGVLIWLRDSFGCLLRGILEIVATPLEWLIRMPLRGIITYHVLNNSSVGEQEEFEEEFKEEFKSESEEDSPGCDRSFDDPFFRDNRRKYTTSIQETADGKIADLAVIF